LALREISRRKPCPKNRVEEHVEKAVLEMALDKPALGQVRVANELTKRGLFVSPTGVRSIWLRHDLETWGVGDQWNGVVVGVRAGAQSLPRWFLRPAQENRGTVSRLGRGAR
jgi:hypothetical protein